MDKVIIDGVDVSGCERLENTYCKLGIICKGRDCTYKQLKRLEQENERMKEENYQSQKDCQICENFIDFIPCKPIRDMDYDLQKVISQRDNYYKALQEIMKMLDCANCEYESSDCSPQQCSKIETKINEVIGAKECQK